MEKQLQRKMVEVIITIIAMIDTFNAKMDNTYNFSIDINKSFEEQELEL